MAHTRFFTHLIALNKQSLWSIFFFAGDLIQYETVGCIKVKIKNMWFGGFFIKYCLLSES